MICDNCLNKDEMCDVCVHASHFTMDLKSVGVEEEDIVYDI